MSPKEELKHKASNSITLAAAAATAAATSSIVDSTNEGETGSSGIKQDQLSAPSCDAFYYLNVDARDKLPHFQYKGEDRSLVYAYVLSPLAQCCVDHLIPRWMAPNLITLIGLLFMISSYVIMWYYAATLLLSEDEVSPPRWVFLWNAICIFLYQTLDNIDGKQARRTGSSSPLGLLFDHGCDAVNSLFGSTGWMVCMQLHLRRDAWHCFIALFGPYALFYVGTWEEYYTGQLIMPIVNGPNEGLLGAICMSLASYINGPEFWQKTSGWDDIVAPLLQFAAKRFPPLATWLPHYALRNADLLIIAASFGFVQEVSQKINTVSRTFGRTAVATLLPFATLIVCCLVVGWKDVDVWLYSPRTSLHLCATLFVEAVTELMLKHTTEQPYKLVRWIQLPLVLFTVCVACGHMRAGILTQHYLIVYTTASIVYVTMKTRIIVHEICSLLNIWCFDIITPRNARSFTRSSNHAKVE
ncbi:hypothetical protein MPSEU_000893700 [Mayamaea pseudoterrestris]|nr:hypothetical protein MPSEU_000893700 [Mayamaea pseudoterrestris]